MRHLFFLVFLIFATYVFVDATSLKWYPHRDPFPKLAPYNETFTMLNEYIVCISLKRDLSGNKENTTCPQSPSLHVNQCIIQYLIEIQSDDIMYDFNLLIAIAFKFCKSSVILSFMIAMEIT